jgi:transmembrane channel-like protein
LFMCVMVYYLRAKAQGQIAKVKLLKEMLYLEAKDKEFLLGNISRLAQGKNLSLNIQEGEEPREPEEPEMPIDGFADETWKYENNLARNLRLDFEHIPTTSGYTSAL